MKSFAQTLIESRRRALLQALKDVHSANSTVLTEATNSLGIRSSNDDVLASIQWLDAHGLVTTTQITDAIVLATLTQRGKDIALNRAPHVGIADTPL